jgi:hypothetical protein
MVELLIFLALLGWGVGIVIEFLSTLAAFPTLVAAALFIPVIAVLSYGRLLRIHRLEFLQSTRKFLPPERFYWPTQAARLRREMVISLLIALVAWPAAITFPAAVSFDIGSVTGWLCGAVAILSLALATARIRLFLKASQRFDRLTPWAIGSIRRFMFWISDNYDFLGEEPEISKKRAKESMY